MPSFIHFIICYYEVCLSCEYQKFRQHRGVKNMAPYLPLWTRNRDSTYHKMIIKRFQVKYRHNFTCIYGFLSRLNECKFSIRILFLKLGLIRCIIVYGLNQLSSVKLSNHRAVLFDFFLNYFLEQRKANFSEF